MAQKPFVPICLPRWLHRMGLEAKRALIPTAPPHQSFLQVYDNRSEPWGCAASEICGSSKERGINGLHRELTDHCNPFRRGMNPTTQIFARFPVNE